jgi:hypothetical protein
MRFNDLVDNILEDFKAPIGNNKKKYYPVKIQIKIHS